MKLRSFANQVSGTFSSLSVLQILSVLLIAAFSFSVFVPALESEAGDAADTVADAAVAAAIIAGGATMAAAPIIAAVVIVVGAVALVDIIVDPVTSS